MVKLCSAQATRKSPWLQELEVPDLLGADLRIEFQAVPIQTEERLTIFKQGSDSDAVREAPFCAVSFFLEGRRNGVKWFIVIII
jgi:hypothetical protein